MRMKDAIASLQLGKKKKAELHRLCTEWSERADDGPDAVPLAEYPRPQLRRPEWKCLNGWWDYAFRALGEQMGEADGKILVPFSPETERSGVGRTLQPGEALWYRRMIDGLQLPGGKRLILHFGAVDERCIVWWNGCRLGTHRNGYLSFSFDVTEYVRPGTNILEICVRDDTDKGTACRGKQTLEPGGMYYHAQSGIWQTVWLETLPENYLKDLKITPLLEKEAVELKLSFYDSRYSAGAEESPEISFSEKNTEDVKAAGAEESSGSPFSKKYNANTEGKEEKEEKEETKEIDEKEGKAVGAFENNRMVKITIGFPAAGSHGFEGGAVSEKSFYFRKKQRMRLCIPVPEPRAWSPESPVLYTLRIESGEDRVESYFAMRSFGVGKDDRGRPCLLLNGAPYFFHGVLDQGYWPESLMTAPADEALVFDITHMKELGFNMLRKHVKIEPARWYWHCDRIGMVVWQDMVNGGGPVRKLLETYLPTVFPPLGNHLRDNQYLLLSRQDAGARKRFEKDLQRMIRQLYNCPCIGMWVPFNEGWGQFDALRITENIKKEDSTRPVDHASGWFDQGGGDVRSVHNYFRPLTVEIERRAFVISEYGGANCTVGGHSMSEEIYGYETLDETEFPKHFREQMDQIRSLVQEGLAGAVYTQVSDIEEETNGLLTYDRKVRKAGSGGDLS